METGDFDTRTICRICMGAQSAAYVDIFETDDRNSTALAINVMLGECTKYAVDEKDEKLPRKVCVTCAAKLRSAYEFKQLAEQSYIKLCELCHKQVEKKKGTERLVEQATQTEEQKVDPKELSGQKVADSGGPRQCRICKKRFELVRDLKSHTALEHPNADTTNSANNQCKLCYRLFSRKDHLKRHMRNIHKVDLKRGQEVIVKLPKKVTNEELQETVEQGIDCVQLDSKCDWGDDVDYCTAKNPIMSDSEAEAETAANDSLAIAELSKMIPMNIKEEVLETETRDIKAESAVEEHESLIIKVELPVYDTESANSCAEATDDNDDDDNSDEQSSNPSNKCTTYKRTAPTKKVKQKRRNTKRDPSVLLENRCDICQRIFSRQCHLKRHIQSAHSDEKPHACTHCEKRFTRSDHLKMHIINVHEVKSHKCDMCEKAFVRSEALLRHKEVRHGDASGVYKIHECEFCKRKFTGKRYLARHRLLHTDRIFACRFCEATFKDRKLFREHERQHSSSQRNFLCSICGESFVRNDYLRVHMRRHLGEKPYKCQYCGKGFPRATDVKVHERYHTGTKPNVCQVCGKAFHRAYNLTIHMRIHTGEKPYKCDHCDKGFAQSNDLKAHIRRHTGERFKCQQCDASFLQLYGLRQHALSTHGTHIESSTGRLKKVGLYLGSNDPTLTTSLVTPPVINSTTMQTLTEQPILTNALSSSSSTSLTSQQHANQMLLDHAAATAAAIAPPPLPPPPIALVYGAVQPPPPPPPMDVLKTMQYMQMTQNGNLH